MRSAHTGTLLTPTRARSHTHTHTLIHKHMAKSTSSHTNTQEGQRLRKLTRVWNILLHHDLLTLHDLFVVFAKPSIAIMVVHTEVRGQHIPKYILPFKSYTFIQQGCIKIDHKWLCKEINNVTKVSISNKCCPFELSIHQRIQNNKKYHLLHENMK